MTHFDYSAHCSCPECVAFTFREIRDALLAGIVMAAVVMVVWGVVA